jgi:nucleotide-binding universal stress UspA family protein
VTHGDAVEQIVLKTKELHANLVVVGHRHLGWLRRLVEKSVGMDLLKTAPCSILIAIEPKQNWHTDDR